MVAQLSAATTATKERQEPITWLAYTLTMTQSEMPASARRAIPLSRMALAVATAATWLAALIAACSMIA